MTGTATPGAGLDRTLGDGDPQALPELGDGLLGVEAGGDDAELLAADARDDVPFAHAAAQPARDLDQGGVTAGMAVRAVDPLEVVDVEHHDADGRSVATGARKLVLDRLDRMTAVEQARHDVDARQPLGLGACLLLGGQPLGRVPPGLPEAEERGQEQRHGEPEDHGMFGGDRERRRRRCGGRRYHEPRPAGKRALRDGATREPQLSGAREPGSWAGVRRAEPRAGAGHRDAGLVDDLPFRGPPAPEMRVGDGGLEPPTSSLSEKRSNRLS